MHDYLTGLHTRKFLKERAEEIISSIKKRNKKKRGGLRQFQSSFCDLIILKQSTTFLATTKGMVF